MEEGSTTTKVNVYILLSSIISKYKANENYQKRVNISSFQEGADDMMLGGADDDEDTLIFKDDKESEIYQFVRYTITDVVKKELFVREQTETAEGAATTTTAQKKEKEHETTYGMCQQPFGILRIRIVEYLAQVYQTFAKEISSVFAEEGIFD